MKIRKQLRTTLAITGFALCASAAHAAVIGQLGVLQDTANGGINPVTGNPWQAGDKYRLVFVTSATTTATSSDITTYNSFVQGVATSSTTYSNLGGASWSIVGSTSAVDARDNTGTNPSSVGVAFFLMDGTTMVATGNADLWNGTSVAVNLDENNETLVEDRAFTGSNGDGTVFADRPLGGSAEDPSRVRTGHSDKTGTSWMIDFNTTATSENSVFAMSEELTVVPEPSSMALLGFGGLVLLRRRR